MDFGTNLKRLREHHGLTQRQLAEKIGVSKSVISFYECKERTPSPDVLIRLSDVFHVTTDELLGLHSRRMLSLEGLYDDDEKMVRNLVALLRKKNENKESL